MITFIYVLAAIVAVCGGWLWLNMLMDSEPMQSIGEWLEEKLRKAMR